MVLCQVLYQSYGEEEEWIEMHEKLKEVCKHVGVKEAGQKLFSQHWMSRFQAFGRRSALRENLLSLCRVDVKQALRGVRRSADANPGI